MTNKPAKRVDVISLKIIRDRSILYPQRSIKNPEDAVDLLKDFLQDADRERFVVAFLNTKHEVIAIHQVSEGTLNASLVHPREVFKAALLCNACTFIVLSHNHPSGDPSPSEEDKRIHKRLVEVGEIVGVSVLDHVILGEGERYYSFKEEVKM